MAQALRSIPLDVASDFAPNGLVHALDLKAFGKKSMSAVSSFIHTAGEILVAPVLATTPRATPSRVAQNTPTNSLRNGPAGPRS